MRDRPLDNTPRTTAKIQVIPKIHSFLTLKSGFWSLLSKLRQNARVGNTQILAASATSKNENPILACCFAVGIGN